MATDDFHKRLERIGAKAGQPAGAERPGDTTLSETTPATGAVPPVGRSPTMILGVFLALSILATIGVFAVFGTGTMRPGSASAAAAASAESAASGPSLNWFDKIVVNWIGGPLALGGASSKLAVLHLPRPPEGWILVTTEDVEGGGALERTAARYAELNPNVRFEDNLGQHWLASLIRNYETPDVEAALQKNHIGRGIYMSGDGHFLFAFLKFRAEATALSDAPDARNAELLAEVEDELRRNGKDKVATPILIDGIHGVTVTDAPGASLISRPFGETLDIPGGFELHAALGSRAVLMLRGMARPADALAIVAATDHARLASR